MANIVITTGLEEPYVIPFTDPAAEQVTRNLAIGKLAFLGSEAGNLLKTQTLKMQSAIDSVNYVQEKVNELSPPLVWTQDSFNINISDQIGLTKDSANFDGAKLVSATNLLLSEKINFGDFTHYQYFLPNDVVPKYIEKDKYFETSGDVNAIIYAAQNKPFILKVNVDLNLIDNQVLTAGIYFFDFSSGTKIKLDQPLQGLIVPKTEAELNKWIDLFNEKKNYEEAINKTNNILLNRSVLYGRPIAIEDIGKLDDPVIAEKYKDNLYADVKVNFDKLKLNIPNITDGDVYYSYPLQSYTDTDAKSLKEGTLFTLESDKSDPKNIYYSTKNLGINILVSSNQIKLFVLKPSDKEVQSWRSQFTEKTVQLTQKSSALQNFLNELLQIYNYTFDAATNVLRAFSSVMSDIGRNI